MGLLNGLEDSEYQFVDIDIHQKQLEYFLQKNNHVN